MVSATVSDNLLPGSIGLTTLFSPTSLMLQNFDETSQRGTDPLGINLVIALTDSDWFEMLRHQANLKEVNFWAPSATNFRALQPGELFLFKLRSPRNFIVGGGIFAHANSLPCSLAWEVFRESNGARSSHELRTRIARLRCTDPGDRSDFEIGCRILTPALFLQGTRLDPGTA